MIQLQKGPTFIVVDIGFIIYYITKVQLQNGLTFVVVDCGYKRVNNNTYYNTHENNNSVLNQVYNITKVQL